jgi:hypothetical protein
MRKEMFAAKCASAGWDMSRITFAKIESQLRYVSDLEILFFAKIFKVHIADLFPKISTVKINPSFDRKASHHLKVKS